MDEGVPGRLPRHEGSWGIRITKKCKNEKGERVEVPIKDQTGEIPMSATMNPNNRAMTGTSRGLTLSLGNFETARMDVWVALPCEPDEASIQDAYDRAKAFCEEKLGEAVEEVRNPKN